MKRLFSAFIFGLSLCASAAGVSKICSTKTTVCASLLSEEDFVTSKEGRFQISLTSSEAKEVSLEKIDLWMQMGQHGHGSSPLKVTQLAPGEYDITKAYFVMKGKWQIRLSTHQDGNKETLIFPVEIKE